ncbi:MAG TPA: hypothetical protein VJ717_10860 [Gemmatimonadaceae bacterium]|nr:hypothetical protein [Gemmatimonadaceae bacterium]
MTSRTLTAAAAVVTLAAAPAPAQAVDSTRARFAGACASGQPGGGPRCAFERRLVVELQTHGPGAPPELRLVVELGALTADVFALSLAAATARDSTFYAVVQVERDAAGSYRLGTHLAGERAPPHACVTTATGHASDLTFGAFLATQVTHLVRCAQSRRPVGG